MSRAGSALKNYLQNELRMSGITLSQGQMGILFLLKIRDNQTMSELSSALDTDNGAMTRLVDRLEKSGYVIRIPNPDDRRQYRVSITPEGRDAIVSAGIIVHRTNDAVRSGFTDQEMEVFCRILVTIADKFR